MSAQNLSAGKWFKAQGTNLSASAANRFEITRTQSVLHQIVVNSHTSGTWRLANGTLTNATYVQGTYTPATGSSTIDCKELEFASGLCLDVAGTVNLTLIYNDLI